MSSNLVYPKGTLMVSIGGGSALVPLPVGATGQVLGFDESSDFGMAWGAGSSSGNVVGPVSSVLNHIATYADTTGELLLDSGILIGNVALGAVSATSGNLPSFSGTGGKQLQDSGILAALVALGVAGPIVDNAIPRFDGTGGKQLQSSAVTMADTTGAMTFPSGGGVILTAGAGAAERKGSFTFDGSGTHTKILTTAAVTGCVIVYTIVTLGTVTTAQAILTTIDTGVGFTPVSADATDSSIVNWAICA